MKKIIRYFIFSVGCLLCLLSIPSISAAKHYVVAKIGMGNVPQDLAINSKTNLIYVVSYQNHCVYVVNGNTNQVMRSIAVGSWPRGIAINPDTNRIYVTSTGRNSVTVINSVNDAFITEIPVGVYPPGVAVNPNTNRVYVSNENPDNSVTVIDGATNSVIGDPIPVGAWPRSISLNPITNRIYTPNVNEGSVSVIDGFTNSVIATVAVGWWPGQISIEPFLNYVYVLSNYNNYISVLNGYTNALIKNIPLEKPRSTVLNPNNKRLYVPQNTSKPTLSVIDYSNDTIIDSVPVGILSPVEIDVNPITNRVYMTSMDNIVYVIAELNTILSTIEAEDYDRGRPLVAYYDRTPGNAGRQYRGDDVDICGYYPNTYYVGSTSAGEWLNYTIDVPADGKYLLDLQLATPNDNRVMHVEFDGVDETGPLTVPNTGGWTTWQSLSTGVMQLSAGRHVVRLVVDSGGFNIDKMSLVYADDTPVATPTIEPNGGNFVDSVEVTLTTATADATIYYTTDGSDPLTSDAKMVYSAPFTLYEDTTVRAYATKVGTDSDEAIQDFIRVQAPMLTIQAEDYKPGGQNVAYYDQTPGNAGGQYRHDDVDIWRYGTGTYYVGANTTGEWLDYAINVPAAGFYRMDVRAATPYNDRRIHVEFDGGYRTGSLTMSNTGGWTTWQTHSSTVRLGSGPQNMRLAIDKGGLNIDQIALVFVRNDKIWRGDYEIYNSNDIQRLSGYTSVTGKLSIHHNWENPDSGFSDLQGLNDLVYVGKELTIGDWDAYYGPYLLSSFDGLNNLSYIGGDLEILHNSGIKNLNGLNGLTCVVGVILIKGNSKIENLVGLSSLTSVGGLFIGPLPDDEQGTLNDSLKNLNGLNSLHSVDGDIHIKANPKLETLEGLNNLEKIEGNLTLTFWAYRQFLDWRTSNAELTSLAALNRLTYIGGELFINDCKKLSILSMNALGQVGGNFAFCGNPQLSTPLVEALRDQVLSRKGIGGSIKIRPDWCYRSGL